MPETDRSIFVCSVLCQGLDQLSQQGLILL